MVIILPLFSIAMVMILPVILILSKNLLIMDVPLTAADCTAVRRPVPVSSPTNSISLTRLPKVTWLFMKDDHLPTGIKTKNWVLTYLSFPMNRDNAASILILRRFLTLPVLYKHAILKCIVIPWKHMACWIRQMISIRFPVRKPYSNIKT